MSEIQRRTEDARKGGVTNVAGACLAVLALVAAGYFFSAGVLFEAACSMGDQRGCVNLARTLRASFAFALVGVVIGSVTVARLLLRARRGRAESLAR
jgi:hypothetical protein